MRHDVEQKFDQAIAKLHDEGIDLKIISEDRDHAHNSKVGGAKNSQHLHGTAMDFNIAHLNNSQKQRALEVLREYGAKGFGVYTRGKTSTGSLHVDFRDGPAAIWGKDGSYHSAAGAWMPDWAETALAGLKNDRNASTDAANLADNSKKKTTPEVEDDSQNEEIHPLMQLLVAVLQAIFAPKKDTPEQQTMLVSNEPKTPSLSSSLGNLSPQSTPNLRNQSQGQERSS